MKISDWQREIHKNAKDHGWWITARNTGECVALMHSELSEALEAMRDDNPASRKAKGFSCVEEELADCIIRILDYAGGFDLDIEGAIKAKHAYNKDRPFRHGREFQVVGDHSECVHAIPRLVAENAELRELLRSIEWQPDGPMIRDCAADCGAYQAMGAGGEWRGDHVTTCRLAKALRALAK